MENSQVLDNDGGVSIQEPVSVINQQGQKVTQKKYLQRAAFLNLVPTAINLSYSSDEPLMLAVVLLCLVSGLYLLLPSKVKVIFYPVLTINILITLIGSGIRFLVKGKGFNNDTAILWLYSISMGFFSLAAIQFIIILLVQVGLLE